jgi:hypothetical protein
MPDYATAMIDELGHGRRIRRPKHARDLGPTNPHGGSIDLAGVTTQLDTHAHLGGMLPVRVDRSYVAEVQISIALVMLLAAPPFEGPMRPESGTPEDAREAPPVETGETAPDAGETAEPSPPPPVQPPAPGISGTPPAIELAPEPAPVPRPTPTSNEPEPEPELDYELRDRTDMPIGATAARKSAVQRNNEVLVRPFRQPVYSITAEGRFGTLFSSGADLVQPFGYGFAAALRLHFLPVAKSRFGAEIHAGHTRFSKRVQFDDTDGDKVVRKALLTDTDFSAGPSLEIPIGPLFLALGGSAGVALSSLYRPLSIDAVEDELVSTTNFMLRGGLSLGIPLLNHHGINVGAAVHHVFASREVAIDPTNMDSVTVRPFGTWLEVSLGYQIWF